MISKDKNGAKLGDYIRTARHNYVGRIYGKYHNFAATKESQAWLAMQVPAINSLELNKPWYDVLTQNGGAVMVSEGDIKEFVEPFALDNIWESYYFSDCLVALERGE